VTTTSRGLVPGIAVTETVSWGILYYAFPVLLLPMERDLGWSRAALVGAFTLAVITSGVAALVVGRLLDRFPARRS
jgi:MFS family permease